MNKEFIPYEQALELKELGFDEPCFSLYLDNDKKTMTSSMKGADTNSWLKKHYTGYGDSITAPLYQQAFRWFREKYEIVGIVKFGTQEFTYNIYNNDAIGLLTKDSLDFNGTYEEAEIACLKKLIEMVKNK
jgi:hypothetical protein